MAGAGHCDQPCVYACGPGITCRHRARQPATANPTGDLVPARPTKLATPGSHNIDAESGMSVMKTAVSNLVPGILGECGGEMSCATCHVQVGEDWAERFPTITSSPRERRHRRPQRFAKCRRRAFNAAHADAEERYRRRRRRHQTWNVPAECGSVARRESERFALPGLDLIQDRVGDRGDGVVGQLGQARSPAKTRSKGSLWRSPRSIHPRTGERSSGWGPYLPVGQHVVCD